jgi:peptidoglycan hydrolase-like protein with peptidoglycan-binding domain
MSFLRKLLIHRPTVRFARAALTGTELLMYDSINARGMPAGADIYAGYFDGNFANIDEVIAAWPGKYHLSISPFGSDGAMCTDIEPGNVGPADGPLFFRNPGHGGAVKPWIYTMASWSTQVQQVMTAAGIPRDSYFLWTGHYIGRHLCGPKTCGYGLSSADATQYDTHPGYDASVVCSYCFIPPVPSWPLATGDTGPEVARLQQLLNSWAPAIGLSPELDPDGDFGPLTKTAVEDAQAHWHVTVSGECNQALWAFLAGPGTYGPPVKLKVTPGHTNVELSWQPPAPLDSVAAATYQVFIYDTQGGKPCSVATLVPSYPRTVTGAVTLSTGSLAERHTYTVHVTAGGPANSYVRPMAFASATFTTGAEPPLAGSQSSTGSNA